jgi:3-deoxy-D-manno-octulosonate 8-phosphate phosphatase (KDO 8-P phosphatase)
MTIFQQVKLFAFDIDGTLTDGRTSWLGPDIGWTQTYSVRDGESLLRLVREGIIVIPLSRNRTECARVRITGLGLCTRWLGVADKRGALEEISAAYDVPVQQIAFLGDGLDDAPIIASVGLGCAVADAHPLALAAARHVTGASGGRHAVEELALLILQDRVPEL